MRTWRQLQLRCYRYTGLTIQMFVLYIFTTILTLWALSIMAALMQTYIEPWRYQ